MLNKKYTKMIAALAIAGFAFGAAGCGGDNAKSAGSTAAKSGQKVVVKVGTTPSLCQAPLFVAKEKGFYKDAGIDVELVSLESQNANEAIGTGKIDAMQTLVAKTIQPWQNGLPVKGTTGVHYGCVRAVVRGDSDIKTVKDLKGKKIGVQGLADTGAVTIQRALEHEGISVKPEKMEVEFVTVDRNSLPQALQSGQVDAIAMTDPVGYATQKEFGFKPILDTAATKPFNEEYCCDLVISSAFIDAHKDEAKKLTRAIQKAALYVHDHPEEVVKLLKEKNYLAGDVESNIELLKSYNYTPSIKGGEKAIEASAKDLSAIGIIKPVDAGQFAKDNYYTFEDLSDDGK